MLIFFAYFVICWWLTYSNVSFFWHVLSNQSVSIFYNPLLPWSVWVSKIDGNTKAFAYHFMTSEFSTVISCNRLDMLFEWGQKMYYSACQLFGIFPFLSLHLGLQFYVELALYSNNTYFLFVKFLRAAQSIWCGTSGNYRSNR